MPAVAIVNLLMMLFAPEVVAIFAPKEYYDAIWIVPPVTASVFLLFMYNFFADFEFYYEKTTFIMAASVLGAVFNIALNAIFIPRYGYFAAGYTTLLCYAIYIVGHYYFMRRINKTIIGEKVYKGKIIFAITIIFLICTFGILYLYGKSMIWRYLAGILIAIICFIYRKRIMDTMKSLKKK